MCKKSIDVLTNQQKDVTCGLCAIYSKCNLPPAIERREQTGQVDRAIMGRLNNVNYRLQLATDTGSIRRRNPSG